VEARAKVKARYHLDDKDVEVVRNRLSFYGRANSVIGIVTLLPLIFSLTFLGRAAIGAILLFAVGV